MSKKNPNDATFRNINALKKAVAALTKRVARLETKGAKVGQPSDKGER